ncbi:aldehyde ferredoxin oxidoreductase family protein [Desulfococcus sp.]|uniref:aldehyde ferredoxin oxidoreductase family protein n=1 Tax=Desulfococcus sp. TaxID=2025834 RepID=UPI00359417D3
MNGWSNTVLRVDLTRGAIDKVSLDPDTARRFLGGRGFNSKTLFDEIPPGIDPLSPENVVCFGAGPLSGTGVPLSSRIEVSTLSPYSGILGDGNAGGAFAHRLKRAGCDQIVITGRADRPKYLWIDDDRAELRDASGLWGKTTWDTVDALDAVHGRGVSTACIGPAGENLVRFASTIVDKYNSAARGSGAVLGSKLLKAVAVRGTKPVPAADPEAFGKLVDLDRRFFATDPVQRDKIAVYGTHIGMVEWHPGSRYFKKYLEAEEVPAALRPESWKRFEIGRKGCHGCPVACKNVFRIPDGPRSGETGAALEFEAISCMGVNAGIEDPVAILEYENLADLYGMDVIGLGNTVAFAKKLFELGILTEKETGISLAWTDASAQAELIHRTALREGFGSLVAEGLLNLARLLGPEAMKYCYHVKGLSRGIYPAGLFSLAHATSTRGADHLRGRSWAYGENDPELYPELVRRGFLPADAEKEPVTSLIVSENATTLADALGRCKGAVNSWGCAVPLVGVYPLFDGLARLLTALTGEHFDEASLGGGVAPRIWAVERCFNLRRGCTRRHDSLPQPPEIAQSSEGESRMKAHEALLTGYYRARGYDPDTGVPTPALMARLEIPEVLDRTLREGPYVEWEGPALRPLEAYPHGGTRA